MGVPKFYRWLSERYPCINENITQNNVPEFDNFYVDMNGVFHICSHPSDDVHFRIPEFQIFENIATYVEFLFNLIQPRKVFFLSVDGVAPRSKMNQQRSRRFKSAQEAIEKETRARRMGETLPSDPRFDSNCITPGTEFMDKLHSFMLNFIAKKIQNYQEWQEIEIIYSGYDVPGEGEHKIMDYIRYCKTKDSFDPDTRHCLYGLDADLINLGLSTHEPYFSVLREEVTFSKTKQRKHCDPIRTNFQFLHLSLLRQYIYHEFLELEQQMKFKFSLEKIIDDWILLNFIVGNDFLPHLPRFHINKGGIQILYDTYKSILPDLDGYLNESGTLNLKRYQKFLAKLSEHDINMFNQNNMDFNFIDAVNDITFGSGVDLGQNFEFDKELNEENSLLSNSVSSSNNDDDSSENDLDDEFVMHKNHYYTNKLAFKDLAADVPKIVFEYIKGIQWVLHYYFDGCVSWNWFYPYHYGPFVSDLAKIDPSEEFHYEMGTPFQPLAQLLAVLPQASKEILPKVFQQLTYIPDSPLIDYFPNEIKTDLNEKIHDYEAIILIPFMDDELLMKTFEQYKNGLTLEEIERNKFGFHHSMKWSDEKITEDTAFNLNLFPNVYDKKLNMNQFVLPGEIIYKDLRKNINLNVINGFPSFNGIDYTVRMDDARIKVFEFPSTNQSMMIDIVKKERTNDTLRMLAKNHTDEIVYINWPLLAEAKMVEIMDNEHKFYKDVISNVTPEDLRYAEISSRSYCNNMKNKKGIVLETVEEIVKVLPLQSYRYIINGGKIQLMKEWSKIPQYLPIDLVIFEKSKANYRGLSMHKSMNTIFSKGKSFYLIANPYYGYKATVLKYLAKNNTVQVNITVRSEPDFSEIEHEYSYIMGENYYTEGRVAFMVKRELNLPENVIRRILGSVILKIPTNKGRFKRVNLGLKLKSRYEGQLYCVPGFSCVDRDEIFFHKNVIHFLIDYYKTFPHVFEMLIEIHKPVYELYDFLNGYGHETSELKRRISMIRDWLDKHEFSKIGLTRGNANYLDNCIVRAIEERIESHMVLLCEEQTFTQKLHPSNFFIPEFILKGNYLPDSKVNFQLFDRVVNIKKSISVPFGLNGTVIGIYSKKDHLDEFTRYDDKSSVNDESEKSIDHDLLSLTIEVMFDEPFDGGLSIRSSDNNVFNMNASQLINISYGMRMSKRNVNFRNVYQPIQPTNSHKQSNNQNNFRTYSNHNNDNQKSSNSMNENLPKISVMSRDQSQSSKTNNKSMTKFNHSENSPFKAINKPSYAGIVSTGSNENNNDNSTNNNVQKQPSLNQIQFPNSLPLPTTWSSSALNAPNIPLPPLHWIKNDETSENQKRQQMSSDYRQQNNDRKYNNRSFYNRNNEQNSQRNYQRSTPNKQQQSSSTSSDSTRFIPLSVARNHQHENVLRRQNLNQD
uniref:5'-3' exoribonuclease 1 n=1 Tax=Psoroptes ovis TaxID=83912 RepID=A0A3B0QJ87_PSOOV|nr:5'-3' exoribonuclease 1 [Psoroptes ovis]